LLEPVLNAGWQRAALEFSQRHDLALTIVASSSGILRGLRALPRLVFASKKFASAMVTAALTLMVQLSG
jgi:hypothetical protein